jgi:hypothetical protein
LLCPLGERAKGAVTSYPFLVKVGPPLGGGGTTMQQRFCIAPNSSVQCTCARVGGFEVASHPYRAFLHRE